MYSGFLLSLLFGITVSVVGNLLKIPLLLQLMISMVGGFYIGKPEINKRDK